MVSVALTTLTRHVLEWQGMRLEKESDRAKCCIKQALEHRRLNDATGMLVHGLFSSVSPANLSGRISEIFRDLDTDNSGGLDWWVELKLGNIWSWTISSRHKKSHLIFICLFLACITAAVTMINFIDKSKRMGMLILASQRRNRARVCDCGKAPQGHWHFGVAQWVRCRR